MDTNANKKFCLAVRMVEDGALEVFENASLNDETNTRKLVFCTVIDDDVIGVKRVAQSSILD
jgi:hypothetical protein